MNRSIIWQTIISLSFLAGCSIAVPEEVVQAYNNLPEEIDFNYHIRPILSDRCYSCHGPDDDARKADLRLDNEVAAKASLVSGNGKAIIEGRPHKSRLIQRILSVDPEVMMPPPDSHLGLSTREKAIIYKWVKDGAGWKDHWSFDVPIKRALPDAMEGWASYNEVDRFVNAKLKDVGLTPSPQTDRERLIRRVTMDLTGLPPSIEDIDSFIQDTSLNAYEKVVDELLQSKACAERLTMEWLDLSRYADSHGLHADGYRLMWPWRDWVIKAFDENMPYDQFATWQIAGDLLPKASHDQILATAFNRNHTMTAEGGAIDEEFRLAYVFDRTETITTAFQGLTFNCARCHDHKFDPLSQKEYYQMNAFFNNVKELGMTGDDGNYGPMLAIPGKENAAILERLNEELAQKEKALLLTEQEVLTKASFINDLSALDIEKGRVVNAPFEQIRKRQASDAKKKRVTDYGAFLNTYIIDDDADITSGALTEIVPGRFGNGLKFTGEYDEVYLQQVPNFEKYDPFSSSLWVKTTKRDSSETQMLLCTSGEKNNYWRGWEFDLDQNNRLNVRLIHSLPHNYLHVQSDDSISVNTWTQVGFTYDGSESGQGIKMYINGKAVSTNVRYDHLYKSIKPVSGRPDNEFTETENKRAFDNIELAYKQSNRPVRVAKSYRAYTGEYGVFKGVIDDINIYDRKLSQAEMAIVSRAIDHEALPVNIEWQKDHVLTTEEALRSIRKSLKKLRAEKQRIIEKIPEVMVMAELPQERTMYVYNRGDYMQPTTSVRPGVPDILPPLADDEPKNRLGLARWLFSDENPLTARVTVNRYWQLIFGRGIVSTPEDFGIQGAIPTHPDLLDWLAVDFRDNGWDLKRLLRQLVTSATYRQSSDIRASDLEKDPDNIWLARGASYRLPAEMIRDNALAASGLLVREVGGSSVKPYQPEGLWIEKSFFSKILLRYRQDEGKDLYRRSMYTFIRRTSPPPTMTVFDQPNREICTVKRENTNTPLQALALMNDPQFIEAARVMAERIQIEGGSEVNDQLNYAFRLITGRTANQEELTILKELYLNQYELFQKDKYSSEALIAVGEKMMNKSLDISKTAALAMVTSTMINHDEAYMKR